MKNAKSILLIVFLICLVPSAFSVLNITDYSQSPNPVECTHNSNFFANVTLGTELINTQISIYNSSQLFYSSSMVASGVDTYKNNWTRLVSDANWSDRYAHTGVVYDNKMWVFGGSTAGGIVKDVWYSSNGKNWVQAIANAPWSARQSHVSIVYDNKMWIMGGYVSPASTRANDVWYSTNGVNWTQATLHANWSDRNYMIGIVYDNKMWIMGGLDNTATNLNDVWYSSDGVNWVQATASAPWGIRHSATGVTYDDKMWIMGGSRPGGQRHDVWYSINGINWTFAGNASWYERQDFGSANYAGKMWVFGAGATNLSDAWYTTNGVNWTQAVKPGWPGRSLYALTFDGAVCLMGGLQFVRFNDVWCMEANEWRKEVVTNCSWPDLLNYTIFVNDTFISSTRTGSFNLYKPGPVPSPDHGYGIYKLMEEVAIGTYFLFSFFTSPLFYLLILIVLFLIMLIIGTSIGSLILKYK